ncbi:hypothetical protein K490DRAFT_69685 [Saccharata proteae CBS 121410]|uniref:Uncharacterized protein n=1 Tax=Saccharata proteae CBS 121410 TaxID=1314787 RepID=A0A9P4HQ35_9PEZI|nr:hypothetical protein K490DRAFT_69685 [Saccharata proteae CBS 121410]
MLTAFAGVVGGSSQSPAPAKTSSFLPISQTSGPSSTTPPKSTPSMSRALAFAAASHFRFKIKRRKVGPPRLDKAAAQLYSYFQDNINAARIDDAMTQYSKLIAGNTFDSKDTWRLCQAIHNRFRVPSTSDEVKSKLQTYAKQVLRDVQEGSTPPHPRASMHLLAFFQDAELYDEGRQMWRWLVKQDEEFIDPACYGVAIELFAKEGRTELPRLEGMYTSALQRFNGNFLAYHFSPEAIIPDRGQRNLLTLPFLLLQGIMTARILLGDWRRGYLALDTALRLLPNSGMHRMFAMLIYHRPVSQGYKSFMLACRSGYVPSDMALKNIIVRLASEGSGRGKNSAMGMDTRMIYVTKAIACMHAHYGAGGSINGRHLSLMIRCFNDLVPISKFQRYKPRPIQSAIVEVGWKAALKLIKAGVEMDRYTCTGLVTLAGIARRPSYLGEAIKALLQAESGSTPSPEFQRCVITAAGRIGHRELIETTWENSTARQVLDWTTLAQACVASDHLEYFERQKTELPSYSALSDAEKGKIASTTINPPTDYSENYAQGDPAAIEPLMEEAMSEVDKLADLMEMGRQRNFYQDPVQIRSKYPLASEEDLRKVYDELTTDPNAPPPSSDPEKTSTGYPLDELRFQNWVDMTEMIAEAEAEAEEAQKAREEHLATDPGAAMLEKNAEAEAEEAQKAKKEISASQPEADPESSMAPLNSRPARPITDLDVLRKEVCRLRAYGQDPEEHMAED